MRLIYHYTSGSHLPLILKSKKLMVSQAEKKMGLKPPALWLSLNPDWEATATKMIFENGMQRSLTKKEQYEMFGLVRFVLEFKEKELCSWKKYINTTNIPKLGLKRMEIAGIEKGGNPNEWYASFNDIPLTHCICIQKWDGAEWKNYNYTDKETLISRFKNLFK